MRANYPIPRAEIQEGRFLGWRGLVLAFSSNPVNFLERLHSQYGDIVLVGDGEYSCLFTFASRHTHQVLSDPATFYSFELESIPFPFTRSDSIARLTTALALMNGDRHKRHRRLLLPAFHQRRLESYHEKIVELVREFISDWRIGQQRDLFFDMDLLSALISLCILIGIDSDSAGAKFAALFERTMKNLFNPAAFLLPINIPGLPFHRLLIDAGILEKELQGLIRERKGLGVDQGDAMSLLISARDDEDNGLTEDELVGQTVALFRGGSKTTASALTWVFFFLDQHPHVLERLLAENSEVLGGQPPELSSLARLTYLDHVIKECLRLFPPVIWGIRYSALPFSMEGAEFQTNQKVLYSAHVAHRDPAVFPEPNRFLPERWESAEPTPYEYFPFSAGPRLCLGANFATMAIKIAVSIILQRFRIRLVPGQVVDRVGVIGSLPRKPMMVELERPETRWPRAVVSGNVMNMFRL